MTGACILGCLGTELSGIEAGFFRDADPWGFILLARNVENPDQLRRLTAALRDSVGRAAPVLVDQEGGRVQRLRAPHWREFLPPLEQMARSRDPLRAMWLRDEGCTIPGCGAPPQWADAHHLIHWIDGGVTALTNGALLCGRHHTLAHQRGWTATATTSKVTWHI